MKTPGSCPQSLKGMHAVVTGGGRGIGASVSHCLAAAGLRVSILGRNEQTLTSQKLFIEKNVEDAAVQAFACDVTDEQSVEHAFSLLRESSGAPDILVNNAGSVESMPLTRMGLEDWRSCLAVNLDSVFLCTHKVLEGMKEAGFGRIVNIASTAGLTGYPFIAHYSAAKHGVVGFTRSLALEIAGSGVTVNALCPGFTDTDLLRDSIRNVAARTGKRESEIEQEYLQSLPQGRFVRPEEVASAVLWLCGIEQGSVNGTTLNISGGEVL